MTTRLPFKKFHKLIEGFAHSPTSMKSLYEMLKHREFNVVLTEYPVKSPMLRKLSPYQLVIKHKGRTFSVIRGAVSFGFFELAEITNHRVKVIERFKLAKGIVNFLSNL